MKNNFTSNKNEISYTTFSDILMKSAKEILPSKKIDSPGWFNFSRDILQPLIENSSPYEKRT